MDDTIRIAYYGSTDRVGSGFEYIVEVERDMWEESSPKERDEIVFECVMDHIDWGYEELE